MEIGADNGPPLGLTITSLAVIAWRDVTISARCSICLRVLLGAFHYCRNTHATGGAN